MDVQVKKRRRSGLRRGFLTCAAGEIDKQDVSGYLHTVPKIDKAAQQQPMPKAENLSHEKRIALKSNIPK
ncbi:hypothetical protein D7V86_22975 [bacterium D16-51]|nr:hypothetical protein D7V96_12235 [bacterium D16-59]RKI54759.1 hypothetical protein D7V86_22975 [bacterium D16-51]